MNANRAKNPSRRQLALWDYLVALPDAEAAKNAVAELTDEEVLDFWSWNDREAAMNIAKARRGEHDDSLDEVAESLRESLLREAIEELEDRVERQRKNPRRNPKEHKIYVTNATRAGKNGKKIACPKCATVTTVYHFAWSEARCPACGADIKKTEWLVVDDGEPLERENPSRRNPEEHKIYVANLAAYNAGRMKGKWIEPSSDEGELVDQIVEAIGGNADDEYAIHDYDNFPNMGENPSLEDVAAMAELLEEHPVAIIKAAQGFAGDDMDDLKSWLAEGYGTYESEKQYAEEYVDSMGGLEHLDRQTLENHFDWDSFTRVIFDEVASVRVPGEGLVVFNKR